MTQQDQPPPKYDSLGGVDGKQPLHWRHLPRLVAFVLLVAGLLWLLRPVLKKLPNVLPSIGNLTPVRMSVIISGATFCLVLLAAWTATWAVSPPSDQPLRVRVRNFLEWSVFIAKLLVVWAAIETIAGPTDPNLGLLTSLLLLHGFSWLTGLMVKITCCDKPVPPAEPVATAKPSAASDGDHSNGIGPNGGVVFDLGKYRAEFRVDHPKSECTILIVTGDKTDAKPLPIAAKELILTTKETKTADGKVVPPMTVKLLPVDESNGRAARFVGTDPGISNVADFAGTVLGEVDGKSSQGDFTEQIASAGLSTRSPWLNPRCTNCRGEAKE